MLAAGVEVTAGWLRPAAAAGEEDWKPSCGAGEHVKRSHPVTRDLTLAGHVMPCDVMSSR